jgi:hypothetical protein
VAGEVAWGQMQVNGRSIIGGKSSGNAGQRDLYVGRPMELRMCDTDGVISAADETTTTDEHVSSRGNTLPGLH